MELRTVRQSDRLRILGVPPDQWPQTMGAAGALIRQIEESRGISAPAKKKAVSAAQPQKPEAAKPEEPEEPPKPRLPRTGWWSLPSPAEQVSAFLGEQRRFLGGYADLALDREERERFDAILGGSI